MARYGVTRQDVYEAASQLMGQGKGPVLGSVRPGATPHTLNIY